MPFWVCVCVCVCEPQGVCVCHSVCVCLSCVRVHEKRGYVYMNIYGRGKLAPSLRVFVCVSVGDKEREAGGGGSRYLARLPYTHTRKVSKRLRN